MDAHENLACGIPVHTEGVKLRFQYLVSILYPTHIPLNNFSHRIQHVGGKLKAWTSGHLHTNAGGDKISVQTQSTSACL